MQYLEYYNEIPVNDIKKLLIYFPKNKAGLYFGLIKREVLIDAFDERDPAVKLRAIKEFEDAFNKIEFLKTLMPYMNQFFKFICHTLKSENYAIESTMLNII